jgi:hypothetical protein
VEPKAVTDMKKDLLFSTLAFLLLSFILVSGCKKTNTNPTFYNDQYVVFAWNDLGMHCLNPTYDKAVILPPYNNLTAQVVKRGDPPEVVTTGVTVEYKITNNTYTYGKRSYGGFWDNITALFGLTSLEHDKGLTGNTLSGTMTVSGNSFIATGVPVCPVDDNNTWDPLQVAEYTVKVGGTIVATTKNTVPTSDEINCAKCHGTDAFGDILSKHDAAESTSLTSSKPVLCAKCHGSPALGTTGRGTSGKYLSEAIHGFHADKGASCYDCHPGQTTKCNRSIKHTAADGNCTTCHGTMANVASSTLSGRVPWENEPKCFTCHNATQGVDTGSELYRHSEGHGNLMCSACHGSPHAMVPSSSDKDNYQSMMYQTYAKSPKTIASCGTCHEDSRGAYQDIGDYSEVHGGTNPEKVNGCFICHTNVQSNTSEWPHSYTWTNSN